LSTQPPNTTGTRTILTTLEEVRGAAVQVAASATRLLTMFTRDCEPQLYDQPAFLDAIKRLILARSYAKVRVLIADPARTQFEMSKFIGVARKITSHIEVRHLSAELRNNASAFLIADDRALLYRLQASRWDGIAEMNDPPVARRYLTYFEEVWVASEPHRELRQIRM
jgi:hypothetical protein